MSKRVLRCFSINCETCGWARTTESGISGARRMKTRHENENNSPTFGPHKVTLKLTHQRAPAEQVA